jgi:glycine/D-amino acid oxidase-like deaminating enzyme
VKGEGSAVITHESGVAFGTPPWVTDVTISPRTIPSRCQVLVVGAGITGLSAAMWLARSGHDVTVIERRFGSGASARSGGVILGDTLVGPVPEFIDCHVELRDWVVDEWADCELFWCGCLELARDVSLSREPIDWQAEGPLRMSGWVGAGVINPLKLQRSLLDRAHRAGAVIVDGVTVTELAHDGSQSVVVTDRGDIAARHVVMAVDATARTAGFDPWSDRVITVAIQTAPLSEPALAAIGLKPHQAFYTRDLPLLWGRVMPDRSLMIGRETFAFLSSSSERLADRFAIATERLIGRLRQLHPGLRETKVCRSWGGPIARNADGVPAIVVDPNHRSVLWAGGYGGHGVAQAFRLGRLVAERLNR